MERLTARDPAENAYFPECFKEPCGGGGCTKDHCVFLDSVCDKLAGYEEQGDRTEKLLAESEAARAELGRRLAAAQKMNAELTDAQAVMVKEFEAKLEELHATKSELEKYREAEQDGRLVVLPCKVGDAAYWLHNGIITECRVHRIQMNRTGLFICLKSKVSHGAFRMDSIGKTVFLTSEEAVLAGKDGVPPDVTEEPAEPEWKSKVMRTFLGGRGT